MGLKGDGGQRLGRAAFGLSLLTDLTPPGAWEARPLVRPTLRLVSVTPQTVARVWSGKAGIGWEGMIDGARFVVERGRGGDHRFVHGAYPDESGAPSTGTIAIHHLSADASVLSCAPANAGEPSWWRLVLDSVLYTVAMIQGYEALHTAALATPNDVAIAITAPSGAGKSTLLSELLRRGLTLMADDVLILKPAGTDAPVLAHPAPPLMTVPAARLPALAEANFATKIGVGEPDPPEAIVSLEGESWIAVPVHPDPLPLRALVVLDRRPECDLSLTEIDEPLAPLLGSLMNFPRTPKRQRARFELASTLAATSTLWRLAADPSVPPDVLADTLLTGVQRSKGAISGASSISTNVFSESSRYLESPQPFDLG